jgi:hypothetical protein
MFNVKTLLRQCLLAVALAGASLGALAGPTSFHVELDTAGLGNAQYIDFFFSKFGAAPDATVTVSNFTGDSLAVDYAEGAVTFHGDGSVTIGNGPDFFSNLVDYTAAFGGLFGFDLVFSTDFLASSSLDNSTFSISVLDGGLAPITGTLAQFELSSSGIARVAAERYNITPLAATAVPEPSDLLMMVTGLGLVGLVRRRKAHAVR